MKLRITQNSIRIRIRKSELATLQDNLIIEDFVKFPGSDTIFKYALEMNDARKSVSANMSGSELTVSLPNQTAKDWMGTNTVGIESQIPLADGEQLHILIEKDFPCLDRPNENKSDTFWELASENTNDSDNC